MNFSKRLQDLRKAFGITQPELGKIIGVNDRTIGKWERDLALPNSETLIKIADYFNVTTDYLLCRESLNVAPPPDPSFLSLQRKYESLPKLEQNRMIEMYNLMFGEAFKDEEKEDT